MLIQFLNLNLPVLILPPFYYYYPAFFIFFYEKEVLLAGGLSMKIELNVHTKIFIILNLPILFSNFCKNFIELRTCKISEYNNIKKLSCQNGIILFLAGGLKNKIKFSVNNTYCCPKFYIWGNNWPTMCDVILCVLSTRYIFFLVFVQERFFLYL